MIFPILFIIKDSFWKNISNNNLKKLKNKKEAIQMEKIILELFTLPLPAVMDTVVFDIFSDIESIIASTHFAWSRVLHSFNRFPIGGLSLKEDFNVLSSFSPSVK